MVGVTGVSAVDDVGPGVFAFLAGGDMLLWNEEGGVSVQDLFSGLTKGFSIILGGVCLFIYKASLSYQMGCQQAGGALIRGSCFP